MAKDLRPIPQLPLPIIETHCHLDYLKQDTVENILSKNQQLGIEKTVTIAVDPSNLDQVIALAQKHAEVYCTQGIHPHDAKFWDASIEAKIRQHCAQASNKVVAIGEIGLDFHYNKSSREDQIKAFETQLAIAAELNLPVVIHSRDAEDETMAILKNAASKLKRKGVIHSFTSKLELAQFAIDHEFYLGFNGIITFPNADNVRQAVSLAPLTSILLETDAPFLTPVPYRGRENAPFYLPFVAEKVAEIKGLPIEQVLIQSYQNSIELFNFQIK